MKTPNKPISAPAEAYLDLLPMSRTQRKVLHEAVGDTAESDAFLKTHRVLAGLDTALERAAVDDPVAASQATRLGIGFGDSLAEAGVVHEDTRGGTCLAATPPLARTAMAPEPWITNPVVRGWRRFRGTAPKRRSIEGEAHVEPRWRRAGESRRMVLLFLVIVQTCVATWYMKAVLPYQGGQILEVAILFLFALLFGWVGAGFWTALMGFLQLMMGRDKYSISASAAEDAPITPGARTAIVMPICNEDVARVFAGLRATYESVAAAGQLEHFDFFVLSDSYHADTCVAEHAAWVELCQAVGGFGRIFYRRRRRRVKRKSGNIDDFCRRWGKDYRYMIVLDADSVMTGECLKRLVVLMEANPEAGIIQSAPRASGMDSLYARFQQFATRVYGPLFTAGLHFWQLGESHYWGHNAIIRLAPFIQHCALAPLPGRGAFSGAILSHDFVEAALMRRAGWGVWIAYDLDGSYEELPPNLLDEVQRDQRWCQGNLMNFRLFLVNGMHPVHRAVFLTGVMSYLSAPLWFLFLTLSTALLGVHTLMEPTYFSEPRQLFPLWPQWHPDKAIVLFSTTTILLFLPKVLSVLLIIVQGAKGFGGARKLMLSMLMEVLFSMLLAPVRMLFHTRFVVSAFLGWSVQWKSPARDNDQTPWREAIKRHGLQSLLGLLWGILVAWLNPVFLWWMAPILVSLLLAIPLSVISSYVSLGRKAFDDKLLLIPEESDPPPALVATQRYTDENRAKRKPGFLDAVADPVINALSCGMGTARHREAAPVEQHRVEMIEAALEAGPIGLTEPQRIKLLNDPVVLSRLHQRVWTEGRAPVWLREKPAAEAEDPAWLGAEPSPQASNPI